MKLCRTYCMISRYRTLSISLFRWSTFGVFVLGIIGVFSSMICSRSAKAVVLFIRIISWLVSSSSVFRGPVTIHDRGLSILAYFALSCSANFVTRF